MASKSGAKRKRVVVTMEKKLEAIQRLDMGETLKSISVEFGVGDSTVSDWKKNRKQIEDYCGRMACKEALRERKVVSRTKNDALDEALLLWINQERERGVTITGPVIQEKALSLHKLMGGDDAFMASPGWLDRFKKRNGIRHLALIGEKLSDNGGKGFVSRLSSLLDSENLTPEQVYTGDEQNLSCRLLPARVLEGASDVDCRWCRERVTILACSNAAGSHKLPLVMIGRAFKNVNIASLPVVYKYQKTSWMNGKIMKEWFYDDFVPSVRCHLKERNLPEKAMLVLHNTPAHHGAEELASGNIRIIFFPRTVTSVIQPMNQGILKGLGLRYRRKLLSALLGNHLDDPQDLLQLLRNISVRDVVYMCVAAWDEMATSILVDCWKHCWPVQEAVIKQDPAVFDDDAELGVVNFLDMLRQLPDCDDVDERDVQEWLNLDQDAGRQLLTDREIVSAVTGGDSDEPESPQISHEDGARFLELALLYVEQQPTSTPVDVMPLKRLRDQAAIRRNSALSQKTIDRYFPRPVLEKLLVGTARIRRTSGPN